METILWLFGYVVPFLFVLTVVVFFHELGHFLVARWCGVEVKTFSIGFGREIFGFNDRHGTRWRFAWIPLGGYVKFIDDENAASVPAREADLPEEVRQSDGRFQSKSVGARAAIVAAGPIANFLLAIVIFAVGYMVVGQRLIAPRIASISEGSPAAAAGFRAGDMIRSIDGSEIESFNDLQRIVSVSFDRELAFVVERDGRELTLFAKPRREEIKDRFGNIHRIGLLGVRRPTDGDDVIVHRYNPVSAVWKGTTETVFVITRTLDYLWGVVTGREAADQVGGPLRIAQISGQVATAGFLALLNLAAVLSVSIGLINLFPIPLLDGGHLLFFGIEAIRGQPLGEKSMEVGFKIGLALVIMLMIFATWNDVLHFMRSASG